MGYISAYFNKLTVLRVGCTRHIYEQPSGKTLAPNSAKNIPVAKPSVKQGLVGHFHPRRAAVVK